MITKEQAIKLLQRTTKGSPPEGISEEEWGDPGYQYSFRPGKDVPMDSVKALQQHCESLGFDYEDLPRQDIILGKCIMEAHLGGDPAHRLYMIPINLPELEKLAEMSLDTAHGMLPKGQRPIGKWSPEMN